MEKASVKVRNDDQRIHDLLERFDALLGLLHPLVAFELERLGDDTYRQNAQFARGLCDDRRSTCPGAAAHARRDEAHVRPGEVINDLFDAFFCSRSTHGCPRTRAQTLGHLHAQLDAAGGPTLLQRLRVGVGHNEIDALKGLVDHVVDRVTACPTHTEHGDAGFQFFLSGHRKVQCHLLVRLLSQPHFGTFSAPVSSIITGQSPKRHVKTVL
jgi:hypothetical protein